MEAGACNDQETDGHSVTLSTALSRDCIALLLLSLRKPLRGWPSESFSCNCFQNMHLAGATSARQKHCSEADCKVSARVSVYNCYPSRSKVSIWPLSTFMMIQILSTCSAITHCAIDARQSMLLWERRDLHLLRHMVCALTRTKPSQ